MKIIKKILRLLIGLILFQGCQHTAPTLNLEKRILDQSYEDKPDWIKKTDVTWTEGSFIYYKNTFTVRGDQRVNACYELARLGLYESLISEIGSEIKAENNLASEGTLESESDLINKSVSENLSGYLKGVKVKSKAFERYVVKDNERVDCHLLTEISKSDYEKMKNRIGQEILSVSAEVTQALREKQKRFFSSEKKEQ